MPAIADQVAALELDHADALAKIDALTASNAALTDAINAITTEKAALEARVAELSTRTNGMIAMAEKVASSALDMLTAARLPAGTPVEVIPFAPRPRIVTAAASVEMLNPEPARQAVAKAIAPSISPEPAAAPIKEPETAVDLVKRHLLPALALMRRPVDPPMRATHDPAGLPMFLRRDTVFARMADAA
jgi:hypothetical protein